MDIVLGVFVKHIDGHGTRDRKACLRLLTPRAACAPRATCTAVLRQGARLAAEARQGIAHRRAGPCGARPASRTATQTAGGRRIHQIAARGSAARATGAACTTARPTPAGAAPGAA